MKTTFTRQHFLKTAGAGLAGATLLGVSACGGGSGSSGSGGGSVTLQLAHNLPEGNNTAETMARFAELASEKTEGQVTIEVFPAGQLYSDTDMVDAIPNGAVDMGMVTIGQWAGEVPSVQIFDYPFLFPTYETVFQAVDGQVGERLAEEIKTATGVNTLMWVDYGYVQFVNNASPIEAPEDVEGMSLRAYSAFTQRWLEVLGAAVTVLGGAEVYTALQRGVIEGAITGLTSMSERAYYEVTDYVTIANPGYSMFALLVNADSWNQLSSEQQGALTEASTEARNENREAVQQAEEDAAEELEQEGMELYTVPQNELDAWREAVEPVREIFVEETGQTGEELLQIAEEIES